MKRGVDVLKGRNWKCAESKSKGKGNISREICTEPELMESKKEEQKERDEIK